MANCEGEANQISDSFIEVEGISNSALKLIKEEFLVARKSHHCGCFWLFAPNFLKVVEIYEWPVCLKTNAISVVLTMWSGGNTQTLKAGFEKITLCTPRQWGQKNFTIFPSFHELSLTLSPHYNHPVKLFTLRQWTQKNFTIFPSFHELSLTLSPHYNHPVKLFTT